MNLAKKALHLVAMDYKARACSTVFAYLFVYDNKNSYLHEWAYAV
jgi:hypothetical protein